VAIKDIIAQNQGHRAVAHKRPPDQECLGYSPRLVLLDLKMPKIGGIEVLRRLRTDPRTRRLPVVVLTSSVEERDLGACYDAGTNSYIRKPVDFHEFSDAVRQLAQYWLVLNEQPPGADD